MKGLFPDEAKQLKLSAAYWKMYHESVSLIGTPAFDAKVAAAHARLDEAVRQHRRLAVAWSGGKDSQVIAHLARQHSGCLPPFIVSNHLEFPSVNEFIDQHVAEENVLRVPMNFAWLQRNPAMLWSTDRSVDFVRREKWRLQDAYAKNHRCAGIVFGRRSRDGKVLSNDGTKIVGGNSVGAGGSYTVKSGMARVNPIFDWSTSEVFAYMQQYKLGLYPPYTYGHADNPIGIIYGTTEGWHQWLPRAAADSDPLNAWRIMRDFCDVAVVEQAATVFPLARRVLKE